MKIGHNMKTQKGTSLLEVMLSLAVIGFGILGVLYLQGEISSSSGSNKQRAEAIKLAEARIEDIRSYYRYATDQSPIDSLYSAVSQYITNMPASHKDCFESELLVGSTDILGENACYRITSALASGTGNTIDIDVVVAWSDRREQLQEVKSSTSITFNPAQLVASTLLPDESTEAIVPAKGIALLGEGDLGDYNVTQPPVRNDDGTYTAITDDGDVLLVDGNMPDSPVLLMIPADTCAQFGVNCSFVTINGRVYIDTLSQNQLEPSEVAIRSSDTTYCVKYVQGQTDGSQYIYTDNSQYIYFDYTCYASFGWHGNIGIVLLGGNKQTDKFCMGDPTSTGEPDEWNPPVIAARRIYRGMYYAGCDPLDENDPILSTEISCSASNFPVLDPAPDGYVPPPANVYTNTVTDIPLYWSVGVNGGTNLGAPYQTLPDFPTHDFVIASMSKDKTDGSFCVTEGVMIRDPDSQVVDTLGDRFFGMNDDFFCINEYLSAEDYDLLEDYVCSLNSECYIPPTCPFDPSDPPIERHLITGESGNSQIPVYTSDGFDYCVYTAGDSYQCEVYDWGNGWTGYVGLYLPSGDSGITPNLGNTVCEFDRVYYFEQKGPAVLDANPDNEITCITGEGHSSSIVRGTVNILNNKNLNSIQIIQEREINTGTVDAPVIEQQILTGHCEVDETNSLFSCVTADLLGDSDWTVSLEVTTNGFVCDSTDDVISLTDFVFEDINTHNITIAGNATGCP